MTFSVPCTRTFSDRELSLFTAPDWIKKTRSCQVRAVPCTALFDLGTCHYNYNFPAIDHHIVYFTCATSTKHLMLKLLSV